MPYYPHPAPINGYRPTTSYRQRSLKRREDDTADENKPHMIDVIGNGSETTIYGHIDLLHLLPLHHKMHRKLLQTFKNKPGDYEGKYNDERESKARVVDYGNGYLTIHFTDDITRPEMSEFLLAHNWQMLNAHCTPKHGKDVIYEKWTNVLKDNSAAVSSTTTVPADRAQSRISGRYY